VLGVVVQYWSLNCSIKELIYGSVPDSSVCRWAVSAVALTILVLMHSGKGTGVSDMIASSLYNSSSATGVMEQNLDRLTVIMAVVFAVCVVLCMFFFPQGIVGY
jgi:preprotein translocase subunit SecG